MKSIVIPRYLYSNTVLPNRSAKLVKFCNTSSKAYMYAAVDYLKLESEACQVSVRCVASKTQVTPVEGATTPQLGLHVHVGCYFLSYLIVSMLHWNPRFILAIPCVFLTQR